MFCMVTVNKLPKNDYLNFQNHTCNFCCCSQDFNHFMIVIQLYLCMQILIITLMAQKEYWMIKVISKLVDVLFQLVRNHVEEICLPAGAKEKSIILYLLQEFIQLQKVILCSWAGCAASMRQQDANLFNTFPHALLHDSYKYMQHFENFLKLACKNMLLKIS